MMAIEGGHKEIVEKIACFKFTDEDNDESKVLDKTKKSKDQFGNNALHYAYKYNQPEIVKIMIEKGIGDADKRNKRG